MKSSYGSTSKLGVLLLASALAGTALTGCGGGSKETAAGSSTPASSADASKKEESKKPVTLTIYHFKTNIQDKLEKAAKAFHEDYPYITVKMETGAEYWTTLQTKLATNALPDIFQNDGYTSAVQWKEQLEDLSNEPWVKRVFDFAKEPMTVEGKLLGMPMNLEGYGFVYHKDMLAKTGMAKPKTLSEIKEMGEKLKTQGIPAFSNGYKEAWVLGVHNFNIPVAYHPNPNQLIEDLKSGKTKLADEKVFQDWANLFETTLKYGAKDPILTDYAAQVRNFASKKTATMQQGNWAQADVTKVDPNAEIGVIPMAINDDAAAMDKLAVGVPTNWVISKKSKVKEEAKLFLDWLVSSEKGQQFLTNEFLFIPALDGIKYDTKVLGGIAADLLEYSKAGKTIGWHFSKWPSGFDASIAMQKFVSGKIDKDGMINEIQKALDDAVKKEKSQK